MDHTKIIKILFVLFAVVLCLGPVGLAGPAGTAFTYQGRLMDNNQPADGLYDLQFKLYDASSGGIQVSGDLNMPDVEVLDGYFTADVNFGNVFDGNERWFDISVRSGELEDPNAYTSLTPRQAITPTPYALYALNGGGAGGSLWQMNGSDIYYNNGNVGIGEANPVAKLVVGQGGDILLKAAGEDAGDIIFQSSTGTQKGRMWGAPAAGLNKLHLSSEDNNPDITIDPNGNVGIGMTSPAQKLHVNGSAQFDKSGPEVGRLTLNTVSRNDPGRYGIVFANNLLAPFLGDDTQDQTFGFLTGWSDTRTYNARLQVYGRATGNWGCYIGMSHDGSDGLINTDVGDIVLSPALNVGIGTTSPGAKLEVNGQVKITGGSPAAGKVLTSDSTGLATWQTFASGGDITAVNAGTGLSGGGTSGDVILAVSVPLSLTGSAATPAAVITAANTSSGYGVYGSSASSISGKGVYGYNSSSGNYGYLGGGTYGVVGTHGSSGNFGSLGSSSSGVYGSNGTTGNTGFLGSNSEGASGVSTNNPGVYGRSTTNYGVWGQSTSNPGVYGVSSGSYGVYGVSSDSYGVYGANTGGNFGFLGSGEYAVYGKQASNDYWAGWFEGDVKVTDQLFTNDVIAEDYVQADLVACYTLEAVLKLFKIDHPLDPENKYLKHVSIESSEMMNIYSGNVTINGNGEASVTLPEWFQALNKDFRYQLTCIGDFAPVYIAEKISDNRFKIAGGKPGMEVSWQVSGIRQDPYAVANPLQVEENKPANERGYYQCPEVYGLTKEKGINMAGKGRPSKVQKVR